MGFWRKRADMPSREEDSGGGELNEDSGNPGQMDRRSFIKISILAGIAATTGGKILTACCDHVAREEPYVVIDGADGGSDVYDDGDVFDASDNPDFEGEVDGGEICDPNEFEGVGSCQEGCIPEAFYCPDGKEPIDVCQFESRQDLRDYIEGYKCEDGSDPVYWLDCRADD